MKFNKKIAFFLVMAVATPPAFAISDAVAGILGNSIAGVAVIAFGLYKAYSSTSTNSGGYANAEAFQTAAQAYADQQVATKYANQYNADQQNGMSTPNSAQYQSDHPADWATAFEGFIANNVSTVSGVSVNDFNSFVNEWTSSSNNNYADALTNITAALQTGGTSAIGKWNDLPEGYKNVLDYMVKNNITSTDAVAELSSYMRTLNAPGQSQDVKLPEKYTPGDLPPVTNSGGINMGGAGGTFTASESAQNYFNNLKASLNNLTAYTNSLQKTYQSLKSTVQNLQSQMDSMEEQGLQESEAYKNAQEQLNDCNDSIEAANDSYKQSTGSDLPGYEA